MWPMPLIVDSLIECMTPCVSEASMYQLDIIAHAEKCQAGGLPPSWASFALGFWLVMGIGR